MKKAILLIIITAISIKSFGQKKAAKDSIENKIPDRFKRTYVVKYDFQTGLFPDGKKIAPRVNVPVVFKIKNINRLAYKVVIESKDSSIATSEIPEKLDFLSKKDLTDAKKDLTDAKPAPVTEKSNDVLKANDFLKKPDIKILSNIQNKISDNIVREKNDSLRNTVTRVTNYPALTEHLRFQQNLTNTYLQIINEYNKINDLLNSYSYVDITINDPLLTNCDYYREKYQKKIVGIKNSIDSSNSVHNELNSLVERFKTEYTDLKLNYQLATEFNDGGIMKLTHSADEQFKEVENLEKLIQKLDLKKIKSQLEQATRLLDNPSIFEYTSSPIQAINDIIIFEVDIQKKEKVGALLFDERKFKHHEFTKHGIRLDASLGLAASFFPNAKKYELQFNNSEQLRIAEISNNYYSPSIVGFFTTSYRTATHYTVGLSLGLGIGATDGKIVLDNVYVGPSLIVGKYERMSITSGVTFKNIPKLNNSFKNNDIVPNSYKPENITTVSYQPGVFIAIHYNLTKGVRDQLKFLK